MPWRCIPALLFHEYLCLQFQDLDGCNRPSRLGKTITRVWHANTDDVSVQPARITHKPWMEVPQWLRLCWSLLFLCLLSQAWLHSFTSLICKRFPWRKENCCLRHLCRSRLFQWFGLVGHFTVLSIGWKSPSQSQRLCEGTRVNNNERLDKCRRF